PASQALCPSPPASPFSSGKALALLLAPCLCPPFGRLCAELFNGRYARGLGCLCPEFSEHLCVRAPGPASKGNPSSRPGWLCLPRTSRQFHYGYLSIDSGSGM